MLDNKRNLVHLELMRIIAIYLMLFNHTGTDGFFLFSVSEGSRLYPIYLFMSIGCKVAVPLFLMISGALLLGKEESISNVYRKRVLRILIVLVCISLLYQIYYCIRSGESFSLSSFLTTLYSSRLSTALWFLYVYLALMMMLPLLRRLAQGLKSNEYIYLAIMSIIFVGVIPILQYRLGQNSVTINASLRGALFTATSIVYFLMGYFFEHVLPEKYYTVKNACIGIVISLIAIGICCYMTVYRADITGICTENDSQQFHESLIAIPTYTIYFCIKMLFMKVQIPEKIQRSIQIVGGATFGVYLLEGILRNETRPVFTFLQPYIHTMPACLIWILVAFALGFVIVLLLKQIPGLKKFI